jgi:prepilin-type N-terminal cleavage/methylation domain-containing protein
MGRRGFTLVELMTAVAIIGTLAAIAIPNYQEMTLKAKRSEAKLNVEGLYSVVSVYVESQDGEFDKNRTHLNPYPSPWRVPVNGKQQRTWNTGVPAPDQRFWGTLAWEPDGAVRCSYRATLDQSPGVEGDYFAWAECDLDNDGQWYRVYRMGPYWEGLVPNFPFLEPDGQYVY